MALKDREPRIVVVGSSNRDLALLCTELPQPGQTVRGAELQISAGGKGANQAVAAARAGATVGFIGLHGDDEWGEWARKGLEREGIDCRFFRQCSGVPSGVALILIGGREKENIIAVARSANDELGAEDIEQAESLFAEADLVVAQLEIPLGAVTAAAEMAGRFKIPFVLNPAPAAPLPASLLRCVDTLVPNETEAETLTGEADPEQAAGALLARGCRRVVLTLGAAGALLAEGGIIRRFPAPAVQPVDTVGAGDCFVGWLAVELARGLTASQATAHAVAAASLAVTRTGAQEAMPYRREVERAVKRSRG
jgi:ribokinase